MDDRTQIKKRGNFLLRQELKNLTLEPTPLCSMLCNLIVGIIFLSVISPLLKSADDYISYKVEYTDCNMKLGEKCIKTLEVNETLEGPILVYYEVQDFYINHKEFVRSKKFSQLQNSVKTDEKYFQCEGAQYMYQVKDDGVYESFTGFPLLNTSVAYPCGLFAKYMFNDTFVMKNSEMKEVKINETGIAYEDHKRLLFKNNENANVTQYRDIEDGRFIVVIYFSIFLLNTIFS